MDYISRKFPRKILREDLVKNTIQPDGSVMTLGPNFNYGETQAAPTNIKAPFMNPNVSDPSVMQPHDWKFGDQWQTAEKAPVLYPRLT